MKMIPLALLVASVSNVCQAQAVRIERDVSLALASRLADDAMSSCADRSFNVSVVVVDRDGLVRVSLRGDLAGPHTLLAAQQKAYTSSSSGVQTQQLGERAQAPGGAAYLANIPGFLLLGGGVPIKAGSEVIGAIGVAGAPRGIEDEQCAVAAIDKSRESLK